MKRIKIIFWTTVAKLLDLRPRIHLPEYKDYPIAETEIREDGSYNYPDGIIILYEWDELGKHWIAFMRKTEFFS